MGWPVSFEFTFHSNLAGYTVIKLFHSLDFGESNMISIFQTMPGIVMYADQAFLIDTSNDTTNGVLAGRIQNFEVVTKVAEDIAEQTEDISADEVDTVRVAIFVDLKLSIQ